MLEKFLEREGEPDGEKDPDNVDGLAGESVARALPDEEANVDGTVDDDDIGEGQGKEEEDDERGDDHPTRDVLTDIFAANEGKDEKKEERCKPNGGAVVKDLQAAAGVSGGRGHLGADGGEEVEDGKDTEDVFDGVDLHGPRIKKRVDVEVVSMSEGV